MFYKKFIFMQGTPKAKVKVDSKDKQPLAAPKPKDVLDKRKTAALKDLMEKGRAITESVTQPSKLLRVLKISGLTGNLLTTYLSRNPKIKKAIDNLHTNVRKSVSGFKDYLSTATLSAVLPANIQKGLKSGLHTMLPQLNALLSNMSRQATKATQNMLVLKEGTTDKIKEQVNLEKTKAYLITELDGLPSEIAENASRVALPGNLAKRIRATQYYRDRVAELKKAPLSVIKAKWAENETETTPMINTIQIHIEENILPNAEFRTELMGEHNVNIESALWGKGGIAPGSPEEQQKELKMLIVAVKSHQKNIKFEQSINTAVKGKDDGANIDRESARVIDDIMRDIEAKNKPSAIPKIDAVTYENGQITVNGDENMGNLKLAGLNIIPSILEGSLPKTPKDLGNIKGLMAGFPKQMGKSLMVHLAKVGILPKNAKKIARSLLSKLGLPKVKEIAAEMLPKLLNIKCVGQATAEVAGGKINYVSNKRRADRRGAKARTKLLLALGLKDPGPKFLPSSGVVVGIDGKPFKDKADMDNNYHTNFAKIWKKDLGQDIKKPQIQQKLKAFLKGALKDPKEQAFMKKYLTAKQGAVYSAQPVKSLPGITFRTNKSGDAGGFGIV